MQNNKLLIVIVLLLAITSFFVLKNNKQVSEGGSSDYLVPELQNDINNVTAVMIKKGTQVINLIKSDSMWKVKEANHFLADANKIATFLLSLREMKLKQKKTNKVENYPKLDLADNAIEIKLYKDDKEIAHVYVGKTGKRTQGRYIRKGTETQSWFATGSISSLSYQSNDWIIKNILDIDAAQIKAVTYSASKTDAFTLDKISPTDAKFILKGIPEGMQIIPEVDINSYANGLQNFTITSATALTDSQLLSENKTMTIDYSLFSGLNYQLNLYKKDDHHLMTITTQNDDNESQFVKQLNNWLFVIPKFKYDVLHKSKADLLQVTPKVDITKTENTD